MKISIFAAGLLALASNAFAADVGVSVSVGQPGFYGRLDIGNYPQPPLVYAQPVIVQRPVHYVEQAPLYMRVPPGHAKHWSKHCGRYNACGRPVYFVQENWYTNEYAPRYRSQHGEYHDHHDHGNKHHKHDDDDHGHHGKGHGHGKD